VAAAIVATITASQVMNSRKNHRGAVEIEIAGQDFWRWQKVCPFAVKFHGASSADAGFVSQFRGDLSDQLIRNFHAGAPARTFVRSDGAKLAII